MRRDTRQTIAVDGGVARVSHNITATTPLRASVRRWLRHALRAFLGLG